MILYITTNSAENTFFSFLLVYERKTCWMKEVEIVEWGRIASEVEDVG